MKKIIFFIAIILCSFFSNAQIEVRLDDILIKDKPYQYDSTSGFRSSYRSVNIIKNEKNFKLYWETIDVGLYYNMLPQGIWNVYDRKTKMLVAQYFYVDGDEMKAIHYHKGRIISIIFYKKEYVKKRDSTDLGIAYSPIEIYSFNKKMKLITHSKLQEDGMVQHTKYRGKQEKTHIYDPKKYNSRGKPIH